MKYTIYPRPARQSERSEFNRKILKLIDNKEVEKYDITGDDIYNAYTGDGGLHGLERGDYNTYHEFSEAKKEIENGQFFTPPKLAKLLVECINPSSDELIADLTCGAGAFFNFMPNESNLYGCELDIKAFKVARFLYPDANIENKDIRSYKPNIRFDYVIGNPPFNLKWWVEDGCDMKSQFYYCIKAASLLKPKGIMAIIVPASFLNDEFLSVNDLAEMEDRFNYLGQISLPADSFSSMGVSSYDTKVQFWQKRSESDSEQKTYRRNSDFIVLKDSNYNDVALWVRDNILQKAKSELRQNKYGILREVAKEGALSTDFEYRVKSMLYQIKCHPKLKEYYNKCSEYLYRFAHQQQPEGMDYKEWAKKKITEKKVISYLKHVLAKQNAPEPQDRISLVKQKYNFVYKAYSPKTSKLLTEEQKTAVPIYDVVSGACFDEFPGFEKLIRKKQHEYAIQNAQFADMTENAKIKQWLEDFTLWDSENEEEIRLNDIQKQDLNLMLQKRYGLLQWEQGSGKTLAGIAVGRYRMKKQNIHHTWVISSAISIRNNWDVVLENYCLPYVFVEKLEDLQRIRKGDFVIMTLSMLNKYRKKIKRWVRIYNQKIQLIFDESDEMSNPSSITAKSVLDCFRRCKFKLLTTGTSTRNNIVEFAPQLELMYNNSANMISWCQRTYSYDYDSGEAYLCDEDNEYFGKPIPAYKKGYSLFKASHLPGKATVFGAEKMTQDIYNSDVLDELLGKTVITRTFEEVVGKEIRRIHQVPVPMSDDEKTIYLMAMKEFHKLKDSYFGTTGNSRKDSILAIMQQITLLMKISAAPNTLSEYTGGLPTKISKILDMVGEFEDETVAIGVRHLDVLEAYRQALEERFPDRKIFVVTGKMSFANRKKLRTTLKESENGILLCTQQSLPSSVNFEYVNKIFIPELHYNNAKMSQFYMRFIRYTSTDYKDIYFVTAQDSIEANLLQMVMCKEKINLFMKGKKTDLDEIYEKFGVDYNLMSQILRKDIDENGHSYVRWGSQKIA